MNDWQPIETAPRDGSLVLAWRADWEMPAFVMWQFNWRAHAEFWTDPLDPCLDNFESPPTHWIPLPRFPA